MAGEKKGVTPEERAIALEAVDKFFKDPAFQYVTAMDSPHYREVIKKAPIISADFEKCSNALTCLKCLEVCPTRVLCIMPVYADDEPAQRMEAPDAEHGVQVWKKGVDGPNPEARARVIMPFVPELCAYPACSKCIDVCPKDAITIDISHL